MKVYFIMLFENKFALNTNIYGKTKQELVHLSVELMLSYIFMNRKIDKKIHVPI